MNLLFTEDLHMSHNLPVTHKFLSIPSTASLSRSLATIALEIPCVPTVVAVLTQSGQQPRHVVQQENNLHRDLTSHVS